MRCRCGIIDGWINKIVRNKTMTQIWKTLWKLETNLRITSGELYCAAKVSNFRVSKITKLDWLVDLICSVLRSWSLFHLRSHQELNHDKTVISLCFNITWTLTSHFKTDYICKMKKQQNPCAFKTEMTDALNAMVFVFLLEKSIDLMLALHKRS